MSSRPRRVMSDDASDALEESPNRRAAKRALPRSWMGLRGALTGAGVIAVVVTSGAWVDLTAQAVGLASPAPTHAAALESQLKPVVAATPSTPPATQGTSSAVTPPKKTKVVSKPKASASLSPASKNSCRASFYDEPQMTASGERFNPEALTAAHKTLPLGSKVKVTNPHTGKTVVVRINDRGPYAGGRCLDLSRAAMRAIGGLSSGVLTVKWERL